MYFKREFDKKHGNCGVLARFVLFLAGITIICRKAVLAGAAHTELISGLIKPIK